MSVSISSSNKTSDTRYLPLSLGNFSSQGIHSSNSALPRSYAFFQSLSEYSVQSLSDLALITPSGTISENAQEALTENVLKVLSVNVDPIFESETLTSEMMLVWNTETFYSGDGSDLELLSWDGTKWDVAEFNFDEGNVIFSKNSNLVAFALLQMSVPELSAKYVDNALVLEFTARSGCVYILEKTATFDKWTEIQRASTSSTEVVSITIDNLSDDKAFYRLKLEKE